MPITRWCWLPSLSGRVFEGDFTAKLSDYRITGSESQPFRFIVQEEHACNAFITVIAQPREIDRSTDLLKDGVVIDVMDPYGICRLTSNGSPESMMIGAWTAFRVALDGCSSTRFTCSAMSIPIENRGPEPIPYESLARCFLKSMETNVDVTAYLTGGAFRWARRENPVCKPRAESDSNTVYFEAYMDLYRDRFTDDELHRLTEEMSRRSRKAEMAYRYAECDGRHWYNRTGMLVSSCALLVAVVAVFVAVVG